MSSSSQSFRYHTKIKNDADGNPTDYKIWATDVTTKETVGSLTACPVLGTVSVEVDEKFRRRGIGSQLMDSLEFLVRHSPRAPMSITFCCAENNAPALAMYKKLGYMVNRPSNADVEFVYCAKLLRAPSPQDEMKKLQARGYTFEVESISLDEPVTTLMSVVLKKPFVMFMMGSPECYDDPKTYADMPIWVSGYESMDGIEDRYSGIFCGGHVEYMAIFKRGKKDSTETSDTPYLGALPLSADECCYKTTDDSE